MNKIFEVPACNLDDLKKEIVRLNKRAAKLGVQGITIEISTETHRATRIVPWTREELREFEFLAIQYRLPMPEPKKVELDCYNVIVSGVAPTLNGWSFVATLDHLPDNKGTMLRVAPDQKLTEEEVATWSASKAYCAHCKTTRSRKDTFLLRHETTGLFQVGRNCLKDFFNGHPDPEGLASWAEWLHALEEKLGGFSNVIDFNDRYYIPLVEFLAWCSKSIREKGFISRKMVQEKGVDEMGRARISATSTEAICGIWGKQEKQEDEARRPKPVESDWVLAGESLDWMKTISGSGDFATNVRTLVKADLEHIEPRHTGLLAAAFNSFLKDRELTSNRVKYSNSAHQGAEKERNERILTIRSIKRVQSQYDGTSFDVVKMGDQEGNLFVWITAAVLPSEVVEGKTFKVRATVKGHGEFKGIKETKLNRCKFLEEIQVAAPEFVSKEAV